LRCELGTLLRIACYQLHQAAWVDLCLFGEADVKLVALAIQLLHAEPFRGQPKHGRIQ
jgi:hypothetical protein